MLSIWAVLSMESDEESDSAPSGKKRCIEQAEVEKESSHDVSVVERSGKKRDYQRTNFTDIAAYLSLRQFPDHTGTDKSKKANFRRACKKFTLQDGKLMTQWKQHFVTCVSSVNERKRLLAAYHEGLGESEVGKALSYKKNVFTLLYKFLFINVVY